ncbi:MAG: DNA repair and recombination protein RadA [Candidatus Brockarchaeota archaeon]|nr:DNA repair and recombination protein RadA [Candidatus Brockarchaeota archaeon]
MNPKTGSADEDKRKRRQEEGAKVAEEPQVRTKYATIEDIPGVGPATASKLMEMGYSTVESLATAAVNELVRAGMSDKAAMRIVSLARDATEVRFVPASEILARRANIQRLSTGSKNLDGLIGGGLETMTITEFFGEYGTGKSQICHQLCINVQLPFGKGGLGGNALYLDTENTFRPERIVQMAKRTGLDPEKVVSNIVVAEAYNSDHQILILEKADQIIKANNIKLIVVDSLTSHFRSEYLGRESLAARQQKLNSHLHRLERLTVAFNAAAVVTNQVMSRPDDFFGLGAYPVGGHIVGHRSHTRIFLRKAAGGKGNRVARLVVSLDRPEGECVFRIAEEGISDVEEE